MASNNNNNELGTNLLKATAFIGIVWGGADIVAPRFVMSQLGVDNSVITGPAGASTEIMFRITGSAAVGMGLMALTQTDNPSPEFLRATAGAMALSSAAQLVCLSTDESPFDPMRVVPSSIMLFGLAAGLFVASRR